MEIKLKRITSAEFDNMQADMELDLIAFYQILQQEIMDIIEGGGYESMEDVVNQIEKLFE